MGSFVLVPGGWHGGWAYDRVAAELRRRGHTVRAITLAGLEAQDGVGVGQLADLNTHIHQIVAMAHERSSDPIILCGHSYGGMVITGAADAAPKLVRHLVYIDAYVPRDGDSCWMLTSDTYRKLFASGARHDGRLVAVPEGLDIRARPHPVASLLQAVSLRSLERFELPHTFISGGPWPDSPFVDLADRLRTDSHWKVHEIPVGHDIMRRDPASLTTILAAIAEE